MIPAHTTLLAKVILFPRFLHWQANLEQRATVSYVFAELIGGIGAWL